MSSRIRTTTNTYDAVASRYLETTRDGGFPLQWLESFAEALSPNAKVFDLGSGPGRDAMTFRALGHHPNCVDLSIGMLRAGADVYPCDRIQGDMLTLPFGDACADGVWASACLLHLSKSDFEVALREIARILSGSGGLCLMVKQGDGAGRESERYQKTRWFQFWSALELDRTLVELGFRIHVADEWNEHSNRWLMRQCAAL